MRSASNSWQMSRETSRMISSTFWVEWMRLVTACSFLEKASRTLMSGAEPPAVLGSSSALMVAPASVRLLEGKHLVVLEHTWSPAPRRLAYFPHGEGSFAGLQVRDVDLRSRAHLLK